MFMLHPSIKGSRVVRAPIRLALQAYDSLPRYFKTLAESDL